MKIISDIGWVDISFEKVVWYIEESGMNNEIVSKDFDTERYVYINLYNDSQLISVMMELEEYELFYRYLKINSVKKRMDL